MEALRRPQGEHEGSMGRQGRPEDPLRKENGSQTTPRTPKKGAKRPPEHPKWSPNCDQETPEPAQKGSFVWDALYILLLSTLNYLCMDFV